MDIAEILKKAKPPEREVDICLDANLTAEHDRLTRQLQEEQRTTAVTMADTGRLAETARKIRDLEERMQASVVVFRMRALSSYARQEWLDTHPGREGKNELFNPVTGPPALIAACCIDPTMSAEQARELCETLGTGQTDRLFNGAWEATNGDGAVPFSVAASVTLREPAPRQ